MTPHTPLFLSCCLQVDLTLGLKLLDTLLQGNLIREDCHMVLIQGSLDGPFLCPLKSCNFRVLVQNSPPFLQDCTIGGKLLGDYQ